MTFLILALVVVAMFALGIRHVWIGFKESRESIARCDRLVAEERRRTDEFYAEIDRLIREAS